MKAPPIQFYERSYCDCGSCKATCRHLPGVATQSDVLKITQATGISLTEGFVVTEQVDKIGTARPLITPRVTGAGCVFLGDEGQCTIHKIAPFGCRVTRTCQPKESELTQSMLHSLSDMTNGSRLYRRMMRDLSDAGAVMTSDELEGQRMALAAELAKSKRA